MRLRLLADVARLAVWAVLPGVCCLVAGAGDGVVLSLRNGGFEEGASGWSWEQWRGRPEPGGVVEGDAYEGGFCYRMSVPGGSGTRYLASASVVVLPGATYDFRVAVRCSGMPPGSARARILQWGTEKGDRIEPQGWVAVPGAEDGELLRRGGSAGWEECRVTIPPAFLKPTTRRLNVFVYHQEIGIGELWLDGVRLEPRQGTYPADAPDQVARELRELDAKARAPAAGPKTMTERPPQSGNLLTFDASFETGVEDWADCVWADDAVHGERSLLLPGSVPQVRSPNVYGVIRAGVEYTFHFQARAAAPLGLTVDLWHLRYSIMRRATFRVGTGWQRFEMTVPAQDVDRSFHAVLAKDTAVDLWLDAMQIEAGPATEFRPSAPLAVALRLDPAEPGSVYERESPPQSAWVCLRNHGDAAWNGALRLTLFEEGRPALSLLDEPLLLPPSSTTTRTVSLAPASRLPGYARLRAETHAGAGMAPAQDEVAFVTVPGPGDVAPDPDAFFGIQGGGIPSEALARIGARWIRHFRGWRWIEKTKGDLAFDPDSVRGHLDLGFGLMETLQLTLMPDWAKGPDGRIRDVADACDYAAAMVRTMAGRARHWEVENEPDLVFPSSAGLTGLEGATYYADVLRAVADAVRRADPDARVLAAGVSGGDCGGYAFSRGVFRRAADAFDIWAIHPYSPMRNIGPSGVSVTPEGNDLRGKLLAATSLVREYGGRHRLWIGELGWALDVRQPLGSEYARHHAETVARTLVLARSVPELEKVFWFLTRGCLEGGYEYGLWRDPRRPLPAAAAYATAARILEHTEPLPPIFEGDVRAYAFRQRTGETVLTVWKCAGDARDLLVDLPAEHVRAVSMTGTPVTLERRQDRLAVPLRTSPLYVVVRDADAEDVARRLGNAVLGIDAVTVAVLMGDDTSVSGTVRNNLPRPLRGTLDIHLPAGLRTPLPRLPLELAPSAGTSFRFAFEGTAEPSPDAVIVITASTAAGAVSRRIPANWLPCPRLEEAPSSEEGFPAAVPRYHLNERRHVQPPDAAVVWKGPRNLAATAALAWNDAALLLEVSVEDDSFFQPYEGAETWKGDSVQIALDTANDAIEGKVGYDDNDHEYALALTPGGPQLHRHAGPEGRLGPVSLAAAALDIRRRDRQTVYRLALPWSELAPLTPFPGRILGFNLIVNDNDGTGRHYWLGLSPGIGEMKLPAAYPRFVLQGERD
ncbi:MAG: hypothetical protein JXR77_05240 [Lentisphaeria bacterium]|nr:hypothetical protein [Lentisphaeria bacterium]